MSDLVFVVGRGWSYYAPFKKFGKKESDVNVLLKNITNVKVAIFTGGEDIAPSFYGQKPSKGTHFNIQRDLYEKRIFDTLLEYEIPMVGICRGAQFLCVMAGGRLCQHIDSHAGPPHLITTFDNKVKTVNSFHHQMQLPIWDKNDGIEHKLIAWSSERLSYRYIGEKNQEIDVPCEYEIVYYPTINALGMQYHPECMDEKSEGFQYCVELTGQLLTKTF